MIELPEQLKNDEFRFIRIAKGTKRPQNKDFLNTQNFKWSDKEFQSYLKTATAYGVLCGHGNLAVVDCDAQEVAQDILLKLPSTYTGVTGSGGIHAYFIIPDLDKKIVMQTKEKHYGEVQFTSTYVVGLKSKHPNGKTYNVKTDKPIATITKDSLLSVIKPYLPKEIKFVKVSGSKGLDLDISRMAYNISGLDKDSNNEYGLQGAHPIHGSDGGTNFRIDVDKNVWTCYRCGTGGDAISLIGVLKGFMDCKDCVPGFFSSEKGKEAFKKILAVASEYGYTDEELNKRDDIFSLFEKSNKGTVAVEKIVDYIKGKCTFITVKDATGRQPHLYVYEDGYYQLNGEDYVIAVIKDMFSGIPFKALYKNEIMDYIKTENIVDREDISPPKNFINFNNGVYDLITNKLLPHSPKFYFLYKIPWNYNPKAKCPKIMHYFQTTLSSQYILFSQELFGYCLYYDYKFPGIFYLYGTGGNGKSVWIKILKTLVGSKNVASKSVDSLIRHRFTSSLLYGKLVNLCGELNASVLNDSDILKCISAGDTIQAEFKGKDGFDFENKAKIISACNEIPYCADMTDGWYQRQYVIPFLQQFRDTKQEDTDLKEKLITNQEEMEGTIYWALQGLKRLLKNEKFTYPDDKETQYIMYQKNEEYFIEKNYRKTDDFNNYILADDIYEHYMIWCRKHEIPIMGQNAIGRALTKHKITVDRLPNTNQYIRRYIELIGE